MMSKRMAMLVGAGMLALTGCAAAPAVPFTPVPVDEPVAEAPVATDMQQVVDEWWRNLAPSQRTQLGQFWLTNPSQTEDLFSATMRRKGYSPEEADEAWDYAVDNFLASL